MSFTLTCSGAVSVDVNHVPACPDGWIVEEVTAARMTVSDFTDLAPEIILLFALAIGIRFVIQVINQNYGRN